MPAFPGSELVEIARELELGEDRAHDMTTQLREGIVAKQPAVVLGERDALSGEVECNEVYVVPGHKGHPEAIRKGRLGRRRRLKGDRGRNTLATEKPPILDMIQRSGQVVMQMLTNVQQATIKPFLRATLHRARRSTPTSTTSTAAYRKEATSTTASTTDAGSMLATTVATASKKFTLARGCCWSLLRS